MDNDMDSIMSDRAHFSAANLHIPEQYRQGVEKIANLQDKEFEELLVTVQHEPPTLQREAFIASVASKAKGISPSDISAIVDTLMALYVVRAFLELPIDDFVNNISATQDIDLSSTQRNQLRRQLGAFLALDSLTVTSKALGVLSESERGFHDARVITDVRPIFGENVAVPPAAAVIFHTLEINYHYNRGRSVDGFFVVLDTADIQTLREVLNRADAKARSLVSMLEAAKVLHLEIESD